MILFATLLAAAFVAAEGGEELRLFQTTEAKDFREIATPGFTIHPYPAVEALDVDAARPKHEFLALGASLTDASAWILSKMPPEKREKLLHVLDKVIGKRRHELVLKVARDHKPRSLHPAWRTPR